MGVCVANFLALIPRGMMQTLSGVVVIRSISTAHLPRGDFDPTYFGVPDIDS
jgi:hypothetical protein